VKKTQISERIPVHQASGMDRKLKETINKTKK
jgi:hypothetical protein